MEASDKGCGEMMEASPEMDETAKLVDDLNMDADMMRDFREDQPDGEDPLLCEDIAAENRIRKATAELTRLSADRKRFLDLSNYYYKLWQSSAPEAADTGESIPPETTGVDAELTRLSAENKELKAKLAEATEFREGAAWMKERAAKACETKSQEYLDPEYAYPQPVGSVVERMVCGSCADAIRALPLEPEEV